MEFGRIWWFVLAMSWTSFGQGIGAFKDGISLRVALCEPGPEAARKVKDRLEAEGYPAFADSGNLSVVLKPKELFKLFHAKVHMEQRASNATDGYHLEPVLTGTKIPRRYRQDICDVEYDPQLD